MGLTKNLRKTVRNITYARTQAVLLKFSEFSVGPIVFIPSNL
jgi:hypothetical protein